MATPQRRRFAKARRPLIAAAAVAAVAAAALLASTVFSGQGSLATWNQADNASGQVKVGALAFALSDSDGANATTADPPQYSFTALSTSAGSLLPGDTATAQFMITNTGSTPLSLSFTGVTSTASTQAAADFAGSLRMAAKTTTATTCSPTDFTATDLKAFSAITTTSPLPIVPATSALAPDASARVCLGLKLDEQAPPTAQGQTAPFTIAVRADQVRP